MAGYDNFSMSNNARAAYAGGEVPFSKLTAKIRRFGRRTLTYYVRPSSYHHTSAKYNCTDFWMLDEVNAVFGLAETKEYPFDEYLNEHAVEAMKESENNRKGVPNWRYVWSKDGHYWHAGTEAEALEQAKNGHVSMRRAYNPRAKAGKEWRMQKIDALGNYLPEEN